MSSYATIPDETDRSGFARSISAMCSKCYADIEIISVDVDYNGDIEIVIKPHKCKELSNGVWV